MVDFIDSYIEIGCTYDDAYAYATEDYERQSKHEQEQLEEEAQAYEEQLHLVEPKRREQPLPVVDNTDDVVIKLAMSRGYSETEAREFLSAMKRAIETKGYEKAYNLYISRLMS